MDKLKALGDAAYMLGNSSSRDGNCANNPGACSRDVVGAVGQLGGDSPSTTNEAVNILNNLDSNSIIASMHTFVKVLEAVVAVHAFVAVVVIPLKAVVRKDLQRRVNDRRTPLLVHGMIKMTRRLAELESVKLNDTQAFTLAAILREMERAIEDCRIVIEHYLRRKKIVRFAKASSWQTKFDEFSVRFSTLEGELNDALLLVIHRNTSESRQLMDGLNSKLDAILKSLGKPTELERSMACYVDAAGGIECCVEQDQRLEELIALSDGVDIDHDPKSRLQEYKQEIQSALATQIEVLLQRNSETVTAELGLRTAQVKKDIELYAQRIIKRLDSGHHERISDPCFRRIWHDATWSDPVQGKTFICTICEQIRLQVISGSSELSADKWAVQFLELSYQSSLLEAINTSRTGFVSVDEINKFTEMKPPQFTLPAWLAYSAARSGFELFHYKVQILGDVKRLKDVVDSCAMKGAFNSVGEYLRAVTTVICDTLFASLNVPPNQRRDVEAEPWLVDQLRSFMKARDAKLVERLSALHWRTDGKIAAVLGDAPLEHHLLTFLHLLIRRYVDLATKSDPSQDEREYLESGCDRIYEIAHVINERVLYFNSSLDQNQIRVLAYGIFSSWKTHLPVPNLQDPGCARESIPANKQPGGLEEPCIGNNPKSSPFTQPAFLRHPPPAARPSDRSRTVSPVHPNPVKSPPRTQVHLDSSWDRELRHAFQRVDTDNSGEISAPELHRALLNADDSPLDIDTCKMLMALFDKDHSGTINFSEFAQLWKYIQDWRKIFETFDRDNSGTIDLPELSHALRQMGYNLSPPLFKIIHVKFERLTDQGSGITFDRFVHACAIVRELTEMFKRLDNDKDGKITINYDILMLTALAAP